MDPLQTTLQDALEAGPIERIEIEIVPPRRPITGSARAAAAGKRSPGQFRWKLWSGGRLVFVATGLAVAAEIAAMIESTDVIVKTTLGINPNGEETTSGPARSETAHG